MNPLPQVIEDRGFRYTQIAREGEVALYSQSYPGSKPFAYEIIIGQSHNGRECFGKTYPPSEYYPSAAQWCKEGWTVSGYPDSLAEARVFMRALIDKRESRKRAKTLDIPPQSP